MQYTGWPWNYTGWYDEIKDKMGVNQCTANYVHGIGNWR